MDKNKPLDIMSFTHFGFSFVIGYFNIFDFRCFLTLSILWEIGEYLFARTKFSYKFEKIYPIPRHLWDEKIQNKIVDMTINLIGYFIGKHLSDKKKKNLLN